MELLSDYLRAIWTLAGCMLGTVLVAALIKAFVDTIRRK